MSIKPMDVVTIGKIEQIIPQYVNEPYSEVQKIEIDGKPLENPSMVFAALGRLIVRALGRASVSQIRSEFEQALQSYVSEMSKPGFSGDKHWEKYRALYKRITSQ